jgi:hypothetical protein
MSLVADLDRAFVVIVGADELLDPVEGAVIDLLPREKVSSAAPVRSSS